MKNAVRASALSNLVESYARFLQNRDQSFQSRPKLFRIKYEDVKKLLVKNIPEF